ncbi:MAG: hypothetical protein MHMPM18_004733 [Marteilia pararefringens]
MDSANSSDIPQQKTTSTAKRGSSGTNNSSKSNQPTTIVQPVSNFLLHIFKCL